MLGATVSFTAMAVAGRELYGELDTFEIMTYRSFLGLLAVIFILVLSKKTTEVRCRKMHLHIQRNIFHFIGQNLWFYAVALIPLSQLFALEFTTPLWVALFAPLLLNEKFTVKKILYALLGFFGVIIIVQPQSMNLTSGIVAAALCPLGFCGLNLTAKILTRTESLWSIIFWMVFIQFALGILCAGIDFEINLPNAQTLPYLTIIAICGLLAHVCMTKAISIAPITLVGPLDFLRLPVIFGVGVVLYNETFELAIFLGTVIIILANIGNMEYQSRLSLQDSKITDRNENNSAKNT